MTMQVQKVIEGIKTVTRREILRDFRTDSCIATTRAVIRILKHFGITAYPLPVRVLIYNPGFVDALLRGDNPPLDEGPLFHAWCDRNKAWSVGVGVPVPGKVDGYEGHLIAALPEQKIFIDASIDQAHRPQHGIFFEGPIVGPLPENFKPENSFVGLEFDSSNGCHMVYQPLENPRWRVSPDWVDKSRTKKAVKKTIEYIEAVAS